MFSRLIVAVILFGLFLNPRAFASPCAFQFKTEDRLVQLLVEKANHARQDFQTKFRTRYENQSPSRATAFLKNNLSDLLLFFTAARQWTLHGHEKNPHKLVDEFFSSNVYPDIASFLKARAPYYETPELAAAPQQELQEFYVAFRKLPRSLQDNIRSSRQEEAILEALYIKAKETQLPPLALVKAFDKFIFRYLHPAYLSKFKNEFDGDARHLLQLFLHSF